MAERARIKSTVEAGDVLHALCTKNLNISFVRFNTVNGNRQKYPACIKTCVMSLCPIPCCMGFKRKGNEGDNDAVDIGGGGNQRSKVIKDNGRKLQRKNK